MRKRLQRNKNGIEEMELLQSKRLEELYTSGADTFQCQKDHSRDRTEGSITPLENTSRLWALPLA